jgi:hypothetical protein
MSEIVQKTLPFFEQLSFLPNAPGNVYLHPVIEIIKPYIIEADQFKASTQSAIKKANDSIDPKRRLKALKNGADGIELSYLAAAIYLTEAVDVDETEFSRRILSDYYDKSVLEMTGFHHDLSRNIGIVSGQIKNLRETNEKIMPALQGAVNGDSYFGFALLKLLAEPPGKLETEGDTINQAVINMISIDHCTEEANKQSLFSGLLLSLDQGEYDSLIAQEIIDEIETNPHTLMNQSRLVSIQNMIGFAAAAGVDSEMARETYRSREGINWWQTRMSSSLKAAKIQYQQQLESRQKIRKGALLRNGMILPENPRERLPAVAADFVKRQSLLFGINREASNRLTKVELLTVKARMRSSGRGYSGSIKATGNSAEASLPVRDVPRDLRFFDSTGDTYLAQEGEMPQVVEEYVRKSGGNDKILAGKIMDFLETMQLVDFSGMFVNGYTPHERNFKYKGKEVGTLWQIRPDKVIGDKKLGKHARKIRIFCTLDDNNACILKILDKDDVIEYERSIGINRSSRGYK